MKPNLNKIAKELYGKIQTRFTDIEIGDENAEVLSKKQDIPLARFFEFEYNERGRAVGNITITLDEVDGIVVQVSGNIAEKKHPGAYRFIRSFRQFAKNRLLNFDVQNIGKNNMDKRDYTFQAKKKEQPMMEPIMENRLYGTARMSYQDLGEATLIIKHSQPVNPDLAAGRTMHIEGIWVENSLGERFRYPAKHINGARALAEHIKHGGHPYDAIGQHIISLSEELTQLRKFKGYVSRNEALSEAMGDITSKVLERIEQVKKEVHNLQRTAYYEQFAEAFTDREDQMIPEEIMSDWIDRLTIRTFNEELKTAFPYIFKLVSETDIPVKEINPDDILSELRTEVKDKEGKVVSWKDEGEWTKSEKHKDGRGKVTNLSDKARRETEKLSKKEKEIAETQLDERVTPEWLDIYSKAKELLAKGMTPEQVAKQLGVQGPNNGMTGGMGGNWGAINAASREQLSQNPTMTSDKMNQKDLGDGFVLTSVDAFGSNRPAVLDTQSNTYFILNKNDDGNALARTPAPYLTIKDGKTGSSMGGPATNAAMKKAGLVKETIEDQYESFLDSIVNEDEDQKGRGIFDKNESTVLDAVKELNDIFQTELKGGVAGINITDTLGELIPDPEFLTKMKDVDPDLDARSVIELELKDMARNNEDLARAVSLIDFGGGDDELGGKDVEPEQTSAPPAPPPAPPAPPPAPDAAAGAPSAPPAPPAPPAPVAESTANMAGLKAKLIKALEAGATLETKLDFGYKVMTLGEACDECGITMDKPEETDSPIHSILKSIAGFWNPEEKNLTIGGTRTKIKVLKGFKDGEYPHAKPVHVKQVIDMIEKIDPSKPTNGDELGRIRHLSGTLQVEDVQDDFDAMMKDFTAKHGDIDVDGMLAKFKQDNPDATVKQSSSQNYSVNGKPADKAAFNAAQQNTSMPKFNLDDPDGMQNHFKNFASQLMPQMAQKVQSATAGQKPQDIKMPGFNGQFNPADFGSHIGNMMKGMKFDEAEELGKMLKIAGIGK